MCNFCVYFPHPTSGCPSSSILTFCLYTFFFFFSSRRRHTRCSRDWSSDVCFFFSSRRRHTRCSRHWSSDVCSSDLTARWLRSHGHTVGHAIEATAQFVVLHGEAIAIGMACEARLAEALDIAERGTADRIRSVLERSEERRVGKEGRSRWSPYH